jgi:hypothetical protein
MLRLRLRARFVSSMTHTMKSEPPAFRCRPYSECATLGWLVSVKVVVLHARETPDKGEFEHSQLRLPRLPPTS